MGETPNSHQIYNAETLNQQAYDESNCEVLIL